MLRFNNRIEKRLSRVRLVDERGTVAAAPTGRADDEAAESLLAVVPPLAPGVWRVEWQGFSPPRPLVPRRYPVWLAPRRVGGVVHVLPPGPVPLPPHAAL